MESRAQRRGSSASTVRALWSAGYASPCAAHAASSMPVGDGTCMVWCPFAAPVVSSSRTVNAPESGAAQLTISGLQFGLSEPSATLWLASASCSTTSWTSATSAVCTSVSSAAGPVNGLRIAVAAIVGTGSSVQFDVSLTPSPTSSPTSSPTPRCDRRSAQAHTVGRLKAHSRGSMATQPTKGHSSRIGV